jgi:hypothetical protein
MSKVNTSREIQDAMNALVRSAMLARKTAIQTDTAIIIVRDGKRVRVTAEELRKEQVEIIHQS